MSNPTLGQAQQILNVIHQKKLDREHVETLMRSGLLSDLLDANLSQVNRDAVRVALKLQEGTGEEDDLICPNRNPDCLNYPDWVTRCSFPEIENTGPLQYKASELVLGLHYRQEEGVPVTGEQICERLDNLGMLTRCLGLEDARAIEKKGAEFFRRFFNGKTLHFWKSLVEPEENRLTSGDLVPCLFEKDGELTLTFSRIGRYFGPDEPAVMFPSNIF